ncbi:hypothetical protein NA57DRAFT_77558 [Rhizodiscina lignyota]|uniref:Asteroid domain-containing protein n=1 Tax=Rhizodiscina lignyota TaxID=1504668 RepID=A0A9P4IDK4_9PEZI|nr:hypothetical protein NA57DRAFT_77558 [Rhizodiscina lignyota]
MGIPHLLKLLEPFATPAAFPAAPFPGSADGRFHDSGGLAVIDGPGLAYHAYHNALSRRKDARNALEAIPPYHEVCAVVLNWIDALESNGLTIRAIFFDGALPHAKTPVRISRLQHYLNQLILFRRDYPHGFLTPRDWHENKPADQSELFRIQHVPAKLKALPASPFLVPAVIESLLQSKYASITSIVPGEADAYCARYVKRSGGTVITGDTDLLVYDIGLKGSVTFFSDFSLDSKLRSKRYEPAVIARRLHLGSLLKLGFIVMRNRGKSLNECKLLAQNLQNANKEYLKFKEEYEFEVDLPSAFSEVRLSPTGTDKSSLDPRVAEYVHRTKESLSKRVIYLPFLVDDPTRFAAWTSGAAVRRLGYNLDGQAGDRTTVEVQRRGPNMAEVSVPHLRAVECKKAALSLLEDASNWRNELAHSSSAYFWMSFAILLVCKDIVAGGKPLVPKDHLEDILQGQWIGSDWAFIHFSALVQAELYSFRILKQLLGYWKRPLTVETTRAEWMISLEDFLSDLPSLRDLFSSSSLLETDKHEAVISLIYGLPGVVETVPDEPSKESEKKGKKKRKKAKTQAGREGNGSTPNNIFNVLSSNV